MIASLLLALLLSSTTLAQANDRSTSKQREPQPFTEQWYDRQCREAGAICPQKPTCQLDPDVDARPPVNRNCPAEITPVPNRRNDLARKTGSRKIVRQ